MKKKFFFFTLLILVVSALLFFVFKDISKGNGYAYSGESLNWESHAELTEHEGDFHLRYIGQENYTGDVQYSYTIGNFYVKSSTQYLTEQDLHNKITRSINLEDVNEIRITINWDGKEESFELSKKP